MAFLFFVELKLIIVFRVFVNGGFVALRPLVSNPSDVIDDTFSQWKQPIVQQALYQVKYPC